jgi:anti-anti-sigma regulatory factor
MNLEIVFKDKAFFFKGKIDEITDYTTVLKSDAKSIILDLEEVSNINSIGIKKFVQFKDELLKNGKTVIYRNCSVVMVEQISLIFELKTGVTIEGIMLPYLCDSCNMEYSILVDTKILKKEKLTLNYLNTLFKCTECSKKLEFNHDEDSYFYFLS